MIMTKIRDKPGSREAAAWRWLRRIHNAADRTLAPSAASAASLREHGVQRVWLWGRGVDTERFDPARRSPRLRRELAPGRRAHCGVHRAARPGEAGQPALAGRRAARSTAGHRRRRAGRGRPAPGPARGGVPRGPARHRPGHDLRQPGRVRAQRGLRDVRPDAAGGRRQRAPGGGASPWAARWTWSIRASPATWWHPATRGRSPVRWRGSAGDPRLRLAMGRAGREKMMGRSWRALGGC